MNTWLTLLGMALVTFATRAIPLLSPGRAASPRVERGLRYVPPALFAALIVPALVAPRGPIEPGQELVAGLVGALVAWRTSSVALTIIAGMAVYGLLRWGA